MLAPIAGKNDWNLSGRFGFIWIWNLLSLCHDNSPLFKWFIMLKQPLIFWPYVAFIH
ncbi:hypothetical protein ERO13_A11G045350v2 [Gossypium hirsutum]|uniref:Uncharacterized protein n=2 Tax=Gossypium TaxID=3633 RepID=A0A5J5TIQ9_GOSBA|nr:hypothetical protein ES319_A11G051400v1 [Gossypium barbadense]KAG4173221.1 hypothetical protein ERO13_A11G045350v2 [Gossypium hirsutum]TYJ08122.1 hypothetical protein E1A91_A11G052800v1 [Gossypium mustelinum]